MWVRIHNGRSQLLLQLLHFHIKRISKHLSSKQQRGNMHRCRFSTILCLHFDEHNDNEFKLQKYKIGEAKRKILKTIKNLLTAVVVCHSICFRYDDDSGRWQTREIAEKIKLYRIGMTVIWSGKGPNSVSSFVAAFLGHIFHLWISLSNLSWFHSWQGFCIPGIATWIHTLQILVEWYKMCYDLQCRLHALVYLRYSLGKFRNTDPVSLYHCVNIIIRWKLGSRQMGKQVDELVSLEFSLIHPST